MGTGTDIRRETTKKKLAPVAQPRSGSLQAATSGDLKVASTNAIEIPK